jgi:small subunit ribosomal protein S6e
MGQEIDGENLGEEYKGYIFKITGGNDKQGFPMKQGVLVNGRVRLLMKKKTTTYRPRRTGERKRKSVRGCICGPDLAVIALRIQKKGEKEIEGVTDGDKPRRLGPKRANYIRKVFALRKKDDVRKYVVRRKIEKKDKVFYKAPKIQRLITETRLRRKKLYKKTKLEHYKKAKEQKAKYEKVLSQYIKERRALKQAKHEDAGETKKEAPAKASEKQAQTKTSPTKGEESKKATGKGKQEKQAPATQQQKQTTQPQKQAPATQKPSTQTKKSGK